MRRWLLVLLLAGCGKSGRAICEQAATRYETCVGEVLGPEMKQMLHGKDLGIDACAKDDKTVEMYKACLRKAKCDEFMKCTEDFAREAQPTISGDLSRREQCAKHVENGRRAIALQTVMLEDKADYDKRKEQTCLVDDSNAVDSCIDAAARAEVERYAKERQRQCEKWPDELAACVMHLPSAHDCKPDEEPMWSVPVEGGADGPAIAWSANIVTDDKLEDRDVAWAANHVVVVADASGLRALRDGKELWRVAKGPAEFTIAGPWIVPAHPKDGTGAVLDAATGEAVGSLPDGHYGAGGDRIVGRIQASVVDVRCAAKRGCTTKPIAKLDDMAWPEHVVVRRDGFALVDYSHLWLFDRNNKQRLELVLADSGHSVFTSDGIAILGDSGIVSLSIAGCAQLGPKVLVPTAKQLPTGDVPAVDDCEGCRIARGDCITGSEKMSGLLSPTLVAMPGGGVAFNDDGIIEKTQVIGPDGKWAIETKGHGEVAVDDANVYTISWASEVDPPRLIALARDTGKARWHVDLVGAKAVDHAKVVLADGYLAARTGDKLFVVQLPGRTASN